MHDADGGRIRYQRRCEVCGKIVDYAHIDKAFDDGEGTVVLTDDDFKSLPEERSREIDVVEFVPSEQVDPIMFDRSYYLEPDGKSPKAYVLLRRTLEPPTARRSCISRCGRRPGWARCACAATCCCCSPCSGTTRCARRASRRWMSACTVSDKELELSQALVESFAADFAPEQFTDDYQVQLRDLIEAKLAAGDAVKFEETFGADSRRGRARARCST